MPIPNKADGSSTFCPDKDEVEGLLAVCSERDRWVPYAPAFATAAYAGRRSKELENVRVEDVTLEGPNPELRVQHEPNTGSEEARTTKNKRSRAIPISSDLRQYLVEAIGGRSRGRLFRGPQGKPLRSRRMLEIIHEVTAFMRENGSPAAQRPDLTRLVVHGLRHHFISTAVAAGRPREIIMRWSGHRSSKLIDYYSHLHQATSHEQMGQVDAHRNKMRGGPIRLPQASRDAWQKEPEARENAG